jgi:hypothetical protein
MSDEDVLRQLYSSMADRLGIDSKDGLQAWTWQHNSFMEFHCILCGNRDEMDGGSTTLFDGRDHLGDLCRKCVDAGPRSAALSTLAYARELRMQADDLEQLALRLDQMNAACWGRRVIKPLHSRR